MQSVAENQMGYSIAKASRVYTQKMFVDIGRVIKRSTYTFSFMLSIFQRENYVNKLRKVQKAPFNVQTCV